MSSALVKDLASSSIDQSLADIDAKSRSLDDRREGGITVGPFGVLNFMSEPAPPSPVETQASWCENASTIGLPEDRTAPCTTNFSLFDMPTAADDLGVDDSLRWEDIFNLDPPPVGSMLLPGTPRLPEGHCTYNALSAAIADGNGYDQQLDKLQTPNLKLGLQDLLSEAPLLLNHFREHLVVRLIWLPMTQKSPWTIMNIPCAMITLGHLTYMKQKTIKHANLANLYAILACASYDLALNPSFSQEKSNGDWKQLSAIAYDLAKENIHQTFELELQGPNKAKYKEQLMAIESITTFAVRTSPVGFAASSDHCH